MTSRTWLVAMTLTARRPRPTMMPPPWPTSTGHMATWIRRKRRHRPALPHRVYEEIRSRAERGFFWPVRLALLARFWRRKWDAELWLAVVEHGESEPRPSLVRLRRTRRASWARSWRLSRASSGWLGGIAGGIAACHRGAGLVPLAPHGGQDSSVGRAED